MSLTVMERLRVSTDPLSSAPVDGELLRRFVDNSDREAIGALLTRHADAAYRLARRYFHNSADAEDAVQIGFMAILRSASSFRKGANVKAWMMGFVVKVSLQKLREDRARSAREGSVAAETETISENDAERRDTEERVLQAIERLPEHYRIPLWLHFREGLSFDDVAVALGIPVKTIHKRLERSLEQLRGTLVSSGVTLGATPVPALLSTLSAENAPAALMSKVAGLAAKSAAGSVAIGAGVGAQSVALTSGGMAMKISAGVVLAVLVTSGVIVATNNKAQDHPEMTAAPDKPVATGKASDKVPLGSPDFYPSDEHPVGWRGDGSGRFPGATPPTEWSQTAKGTAYETKNILWKARLPFSGASCPIIVGEKVFVTGCGNADIGPMDLMCLDRRDGKVLWIRTLTYYHTLTEAEKKRLTLLHVSVDMADDKKIFLLADRKLDPSAANLGNFSLPGTTLAKAELLGAESRVIQLTTAAPLALGQAFVLKINGLRSADGQSATEELKFTALPGKPVTDKPIADFLVGEARENVDFGTALNQDLIGEATVKPVPGDVWKCIRDEGCNDLGRVVSTKGNTLVHAHVYLWSDSAKTVQLCPGSELIGCGIKITVNGAGIYKNAVSAGTAVGNDKVSNVALKQGWNRVLLGICTRWGAWGFELKVMDKAANGPAQGVRYSIDGPNTENLMATYAAVPAIPNFIPVEAQARPLVEKLATMNEELVRQLNAVLGKTTSVLYPSQLNAPDGRSNQLRSELIGKMNQLMVEYDRRRYAPQGRNDWGWASPTACSDGTNVYVYFSGRLAGCYDLNGNAKWITLQPVARNANTEHGTHGSPLLSHGKFVIPYASTVLALDAATGDHLWTEGIQPTWGIAYSSVITTNVGKDTVVLLAHGQGVDLATGHTVWGRMDDGSFQGENTTPVAQDGVLYSYERGGLRAIHLPSPMPPPNSNRLPIAWTIKPDELYKNLTDGVIPTYDPHSQAKTPAARNYQIASPVLVDGLLYALNDQGVVAVADAKQGKLLYRYGLDFKAICPGVSASPTYAGSDVYTMDNQGWAAVLKAGPTFKQIALNRIESLNDRKEQENFLASPTFAGKCMYVRGDQFLYCIGEK